MRCCSKACCYRSCAYFLVAYEFVGGSFALIFREYIGVILGVILIIFGLLLFGILVRENLKMILVYIVIKTVTLILTTGYAIYFFKTLSFRPLGLKILFIILSSMALSLDWFFTVMVYLLYALLKKMRDNICYVNNTNIFFRQAQQEDV